VRRRRWTASAAAVHDAVGVRVREVPILPWKVLA